MMRTFIVALCFLLLHTILAADAMALTRSDVAPSPQAVKVAAAVTKLASGEGALVALRLQDKTLVKGRIAAVAGDSFLVTDNDSGATQRVLYAEVKQLEGYNLFTGTRVGVGGGLRAKIMRAAAFLLPVHPVQKNSLTSGERTLLIGIIVGILIAILLAKVL